MSRYAIKGWLSFDVEEGEDPVEALSLIEASFDNDMGSAIHPGLYFSVDDEEGPHMEDEGAQN